MLNLKWLFNQVVLIIQIDSDGIQSWLGMLGMGITEKGWQAY